ncbi:MAG: ABC transporter ATP-binding protein [Chloroflexi bacterium]|nr:ABC transporter ATP-binding protein [Chloroflexota bacterium]
MSSIRLGNLRKEFGPVVALKSLSLEFGDGEFAALLGPSGCGKSTTMNMIAGLELPTTGSIYFGDRCMNDVPAGKRGVGFVFQNYAIFTHMNVYDNIAFGLKIHKRPEAEIRREVQQVTELLHLSDLLTLNAGRLSVNDMQKVALGRSMVMKPRIFLLDEPFSNLDAAFRFYMRGELKRIQRDIKQTMIYVTHDQVEAMSMADKIAVMDYGVLQQFGSPDEIYNYPVNTFVARFIGSPSMNFIRCSYQAENGQTFLAQPQGSIHAPVDDRRRQIIEGNHQGDDLILGIRPEYLRLHDQPQPTAWTGQVYALEPLGSKTIVHIQAGQEILQVVAPADYRPAVGTAQWLEYNPAHLHIFAVTTGQVIR